MSHQIYELILNFQHFLHGIDPGATTTARFTFVRSARVLSEGHGGTIRRPDEVIPMLNYLT